MQDVQDVQDSQGEGQNGPTHQSSFVSIYTQWWPHIQVTFGTHPKSKSEFDQYLQWVESFYDQKKPFKVLFDGSAVSFQCMRYVHEQVAFMRRNEENTKKYMKRAAIVVSSSIAKQIVELIFRLKPPATPMKIFNDLEEAWLWLTAEE